MTDCPRGEGVSCAQQHKVVEPLVNDMMIELTMGHTHRLYSSSMVVRDGREGAFVPSNGKSWVEVELKEVAGVRKGSEDDVKLSTVKDSPGG